MSRERTKGGDFNGDSGVDGIVMNAVKHVKCADSVINEPICSSSGTSISEMSLALVTKIKAANACNDFTEILSPERSFDLLVHILHLT